MTETVHHKPKRGGAVRLIVFLAVLVVLSAGGVFAWKFVFSGPKNTDEQTKTYDGEISRLDVDANSGNAVIVAGDGDAVTVKTKLEWRGNNKPGSEQNLTGKTLKVAATGCEGVELFGGFSCEVNYRIEVPADIALNARVDSGDLTVAGIKGEQTLVCDSGDVEVEGSGGKLSVQADSGDVVGRDLEATTVEANVDSGNAELAFNSAPELVKAKADSGDLTISVPKVDDGYDVSVTVDSGDMNVQVADTPESPHRIDGNVDSGDFTVDYS